MFCPGISARPWTNAPFRLPLTPALGVDLTCALDVRNHDACSVTSVKHGKPESRPETVIDPF